MGYAAKVGVVTVTFNSGQVIDAFMKSIYEQTHQNFILYVIDNESKDDTLLKLEKYKEHTNTIITKNNQNIGVAAGNNQGIKAALAAECDYVLLINNDTEFEPELITKLINGLDKYCCDLIVPKMLYHDDPSRIWCAGGRFEPWKAYKNIHIGEGELDSAQYNKAECITYAPTCCMLITGRAFEAIGFMDEKYFVYFDDTDFCLRALRSEFKMFYLPTARLTHKVSSLTGGTTSNFTMHYMIRNRVYFVRKNLGRLYSFFILIYIQFSLIIRLILQMDNWSAFLVKEKAFFLGIDMDKG